MVINLETTQKVKENVQKLYDAGYIRQALEKSGACIPNEEINWIMSAIKQRLNRGNST